MSATFNRDATERAVRTAIQTGVAALGIDVVNLANVGLDGAAIASLIGAAASVVTSFIARHRNNPDSASLVDLPGRHAAPE